MLELNVNCKTGKCVINWCENKGTEGPYRDRNDDYYGYWYYCKKHDEQFGKSHFRYTLEDKDKIKELPLHSNCKDGKCVIRNCPRKAEGEPYCDTINYFYYCHDHKKYAHGFKKYERAAVCEQVVFCVRCFREECICLN